LFKVLGKTSSLMGDVGIASAAKLCLNYFLALTFQGLSETVLFAQREKIDPKAMLDLINESPLGSASIKTKSRAIQEKDFSASFALKHIAKDLRLVREEGMNFPLASPLMASFASAAQTGFGELDAISIFSFLEKNS